MLWVNRYRNGQANRDCSGSLRWSLSRGVCRRKDGVDRKRPPVPPQVEAAASRPFHQSEVRFGSRFAVGVAFRAASALPWWSQPVDATLYLKGEMECTVMDQRFHRGFTTA